MTSGWQDELCGWEMKAFGKVLSQNRSVIFYYLPYSKLTCDLLSKMWFCCQAQLVVPRGVLLRWEKWHLLKEGIETLMKDWQLSLFVKSLEFNLIVDGWIIYLATHMCPLYTALQCSQWFSLLLHHINTSFTSTFSSCLYLEFIMDRNTYRHFWNVKYKRCLSNCC